MNFQGYRYKVVIDDEIKRGQLIIKLYYRVRDKVQKLVRYNYTKDIFISVYLGAIEYTAFYQNSRTK